MKRLMTITLTALLCLSMIGTAFAGENVTIEHDLYGKGEIEKFYVIPNVLSKDGEVKVETSYRNAFDVPCFTVGVGTKIDISRLQGSVASKSELRADGVYYTVPDADVDYSKLLVYHGDLDERTFDDNGKPDPEGYVTFSGGSVDMGFPLEDGSYVEFLAEGDYIFSAWPPSAMDERDRGTVLLHVVADGAAPIAPTSVEPKVEAQDVDQLAPPVIIKATEEAVKVTTAPVNGDVIYKFQAGDTFGHLSLNYYGDMKYHQALYAYNKAAINKAGGLRVGLELVIPNSIGNGIIEQPVLNDGEVLYRVQANDTLGTIAYKTYKDSTKYKAIFERNSNILKNANLIYEGQIIVLPKL